jgi:hypothetical protein
MLRSATSPRPARRREPLCHFEALPRSGRHPVPSRRALPLLRRSYGLMRQTKTLPPAPVPLADGSLQVVASPCWEMALPDVVSDFHVQVLGPIPRDVLLVLIPVSSQETPASHLVERVSHIACPRQCSFHRGAVFEAAVIHSCSGPCTRSASRLHPPRDQHHRPRAARPYTPRRTRLVTQTEQRHRYVPVSGNWYGWTFTSWTFSLVGCSSTIRLLRE